jgi:hypothetical protein
MDGQHLVSGYGRSWYDLFCVDFTGRRFCSQFGEARHAAELSLNKSISEARRS